MRNRPMSHRISGLILVALAIAALSGCSKQRAQWSLGSAQKHRAKIADYLDESFRKTESYRQIKPQVDSLDNQIQGVTNRLNQGDAAGALTDAKQAATTAKNLRDELQTVYSAHLKSLVNEDVQVLRANQAMTLDANVFNEVQELQAEVDTQHAEGDFDNAIDAGREAHGKTTNLLEPQRQQAVQGLAELRNKHAEMVREQAAEYAPEYKTNVEQMTSQIVTLIDQQRFYTQAITQIEQGQNLAQEGITEALKQRSEEKRIAVQSGLDEARQLGGGEQYATDRFNTASEKYAELSNRWDAGEYRVVLDQIDMLQEEVDNLIIQVKREGAEDLINQTRNALIALTGGGANDYPDLKVSVDEIDELLKEAQSVFEEAQYVEAKKLCRTALAKAENARSRFDGMASDHIRAAENALNEARSVFETAQSAGFFIQESEGDILPVDQPFEKSKKTLYEEIRAALNSIQRDIEVSKTRRGEEKFKSAIVNAEAAEASARQNILETYRVGGHGALVELASRATHLEKDGAAEMAPVEMGEVKIQVSQLRELLGGGDYRAAIDKAADVRASLENAVTKLDAETRNLLAQGRQRYQSAVESGAMRRKPEKTRLADQLLNEASQILGQKNQPLIKGHQIVYKNAIERSREAMGLIQAVRTEIAMEDAQDAINRAEVVLAKALQAGAEVYAAPMARDAEARLEQARSLESEKDYVEARIAAEESFQIANNALYDKIRRADEAIMTARVYRGWDIKHEELSDAIIMNQKAKQMMQEGHFQHANEMADEAIENAKALTSFSKERDFMVRADELKSFLTDSLREGSGYFQPTKIRSMLEELYQMTETFTPAKYDGYNTRLAGLQGQIENTVAATPQRVQEILESQRERLVELEELGARDLAEYELEMARNVLRQAEVEYDRGEYRLAYSHIRKGIRFSNTITTSIAKENYSEKASGVLKDLAETMYKFRSFLNLDPNHLKPHVSGFHSAGRVIALTGTNSKAITYSEDGSRKILNNEPRIDPIDFKEAVDNIYYDAMAIDPHPSQVYLHRRLIRTLRNARDAGKVFERFLSIDQFPEERRKELIDVAYGYVDEVKKGQEYLRDRLLAPSERRVDSYPQSLEIMLPVR